MNTLENLYYGNIDLHEHTVSNGTDKGELLETVVRPEKELRTLSQNNKWLCLTESGDSDGDGKFNTEQAFPIESRT